jgi:hypothetical protein
MTIPIDLPGIMKELNLDVPVYRVQTHDDCIELHLYGGKVVTWKPKKGDPLPVSSDQEEFPLANQESTKVHNAPEKNSNERDTRKRRVKQ